MCHVEVERVTHALDFEVMFEVRRCTTAAGEQLESDQLDALAHLTALTAANAEICAAAEQIQRTTSSTCERVDRANDWTAASIEYQSA